MTTNDTNTTRPATAPQSPRDMARTFGRALFGTELRVLMVILALVVAGGLASATWGYAVLIVVALCLVPVMFGVMMLITVGK